MSLDKKWILKPKGDAKKLQHLREVLNVSELVAGLLLERGIEDFDSAKSFFRPNLSELHDPFLMKDMDKAVKRIQAAIDGGEGILIYGDYDVDGTTSVSLIASFLKDIYPHFQTYIPDRYKEGYGLSKAGIDFAAQEGLCLVIALDCGIKAVDKVEYAKELGIDLIICDHHNPGEIIPDAVAVLDPKQKDCPYPYKELSGCGVGFKLVQALCKTWDLPDKYWMPLLDLLALSIGSDIVPITGENRILAYHGLKLLNHRARPGIEAIIDLSGRKKPFTITDVVFTIGPRINAAGRMDHGHKAVELLTTDDQDGAELIAKNVNKDNTERKVVEAEILDLALDQVKEQGEEDRKSTVVYSPAWNKGVIGIVASKLIEHHYYRPTLVFTKSGSKLAASARSVPGFNVYEALEACADVLEQFGGHMYAAGMTLEESRYQELKDRFEQVVSERIKPEQLMPRIDVDAELTGADLSHKTLAIIKQFEPFGPQNMQPIFAIKNLEDTGRSKQVGADKTHLKLSLKTEEGLPVEGIAFSMGDKLELLQNGPVHLCFHLEENEWQGVSTIQLRVLDIKPAVTKS